MLRTSRTLAATAAAIAATAVFAGCTSSSGVTPQTLAPSTSTSSSSQAGSVLAPSSPASATNGPAHASSTTPRPVTSQAPPTSKTADREAADRAAIEAVWAKYWTIDLFKLPVEQQRSALAQYATDPQLSRALASAAEFKAAGKANYGTAGHRVYWVYPVAGKSEASFGDCMDNSKTGSINVKTGEKLTVGVPRDNSWITVKRDPKTGAWKVSNLQFLVKIACPRNVH